MLTPSIFTGLLTLVTYSSVAGVSSYARLGIVHVLCKYGQVSLLARIGWGVDPVPIGSLTVNVPSVLIPLKSVEIGTLYWEEERSELLLFEH